jgi:trans-aconitate methyltransferase
MPSYDLSDRDVLNREVKRLPLQAQVLFPLEVPFLKKHGVSNSCSLGGIGCGDGSWLNLFRSEFPNSTTTGLDHSPEILASARQQNPEAGFLLADEKNISEVLLASDFNVALLCFALQHMSPDTRTRILSALRSRKTPTQVIAIDGDDHRFVFSPPSDAIQALVDANGRKQAAQVATET